MKEEQWGLNADPRQEIAVFAENDFDREHLCQAIEAAFPEELRVIPVTISTLDILKQPPKAVVVNKTSLKEASVYFPDSKVIYIRRFISGSNLEQLVHLPGGKKVLIANKPQEIAEETVNDLKAIGINHLNLIPYWPGSGLDTSAYDTVAYAGFRSYCPDHMTQYIDLGYRSMLPSSLAELAKLYNLSTQSIDGVQMQFVKMLVNGVYHTKKANLETHMLKLALEQVCQLSASGILNVDHMGIIRICNKTAEKLLGIPADGMLNQEYQSILYPFQPLLRLLERGEECANEMIYIRKKGVLVTLNYVSIDEQRQTVLNLTPVAILQDTEEKVRSNIHHRGFTAKYSFSDIRGNSQPLRHAVTLASYFSASDTTVLITGESGTGKELFAQSIHRQSARSNEPFVGVNFAAIPENLMESELFGYDEGAFTGAVKGGKQGLFRCAHKGTVFLDEIGDISLSMQSRLLRVLEEREVMPVGSGRMIPVDVRILCATNRSLLQMVKEGSFRSDLYYRLKAFQLVIPPLRERREDIPLLLESLSGLRLPENELQRFMDYDWPGNIRELKSIARQLSLFRRVPDSETEERIIWDEILQTFFGERETSTCRDLPTKISEEDLLILSCAYDMKQEHLSAGRYSLAKQPQIIRWGLTEAKLKTRLTSLRERGYIQVGKTKCGVTLTNRGIQAVLNQKIN